MENKRYLRENKYLREKKVIEKKIKNEDNALLEKYGARFGI